MSCSIARKLFVLSLITVPACVDGDEALLDAADADVVADDDVISDDSDAVLVELDDFALVAPPPGTSVWSERIYDDGSTRNVMLHTDLAGMVYVEELDHDLSGELSTPMPEPTAVSVCDDGAYSLQPYKWTKTLQWYLNADTTPSGMNKDTVETKIKAGFSHITSSYNSCNLSDAVSAVHSYLGRKVKNANIDASGNCTTNDSVNMVSFGDLPKGTLGVTCVWFSGSTAVNADMKLNKVDHSWTTSTSGCTTKFAIEAVVTHEAGHAFGLGHVSESSHPNMTMSTAIGPCDNSSSTLGRGDVLGLRARY